MAKLHCTIHYGWKTLYILTSGLYDHQLWSVVIMRLQSFIATRASGGAGRPQDEVKPPKIHLEFRSQKYTIWKCYGIFETHQLES